MREIKFRAWIPKEPESEDYIVDYEMCYDLGFEEYEPLNDQLKSVKHLMQFTGLKDKNGVDIYEGDIVKYIDKVYEIWWSNEGCFRFRDWSYDYFLHVIISGCEVIGNIHENPKLLEAIK